LKLLADESVDCEIVDRLRQDGHTIIYVAEAMPGAVDEQVLNRANQEPAVLVTADKDFGELVFRQKLASHGVVLLRLAGLSATMKADEVASAISSHWSYPASVDT
jgi:predicted nuclease of predicted toxin-antitoxin system